MDINDWRGVATIMVMVGFLAVCAWAFSGKRKQRFDEAANLPFADEQDEPEAPDKRETDEERP